MAFFEGIKMTGGYGSGPDIISSCSVNVNKGEIVSILGPNGAGKSTAMKAMLGLLKLKSGKVVIDGQDISNLNPQDRVKLGIAFVPQNRNVFAGLTVKENLEIYGRLYSVKNLTRRIHEISDDLNLSSFLNKKTGELSSGQKNRVSLAKALINEPKVLLLDEPTASLDPEVGDFVRSFLENYKKEKKISILLASHNMNEVTRLCKSILMMKDGKLIDSGNPEMLIQKHGRKNLEEVFLKLSRSKNEYN